MDGVDADHAFAAVEQCRQDPTDPLVLERADRIPARYRGVAHGIESLGELDDLIDARIGAGEELDLAGAPAGDPPLVFQMKLHALAARANEFPILGRLDPLPDRAGGGALHAVARGGLVDPERTPRLLGV